MFNEDFSARLLAETPSPYLADLGDYLSHVEELSRQLSGEAKDLLRQLKDEEIKYHQFFDIPVAEEMPPTATSYASIIPKNTFQCEGVIGAVSVELGNLFNYRETSEYILYDVFPVKGYEHSRSFVNSRKMLSFHSDGSAHPELCPDYVLLYCVRGDQDATNLIVDLDTLIECLPVRDVEILTQPLFRHLVSQSPEYYELKPILYDEGRHFTAKYDEDNTFAVGAEAMRAQQSLNDALREVAVEVENFSNSLLVMNNRRCLHARTSFNPRFDGADRWIKCAFVTTEDVDSGSIVSLALQPTR